MTTYTHDKETRQDKLNNLPESLQPLTKERRWVLWKYEDGKNGKKTKVPYQALNPNKKAACDKFNTWSSYEETLDTVDQADGIAYCLQGDCKVSALDLDKCLNDGQLEEWVLEFIERAPTAYLEVTPSGTGIRIIGLSDGEKIHRSFKGVRHGFKSESEGVEVYRKAERFITITGEEFGAVTCKELPSIDDLISAVIKDGDKHQERDFLPFSWTSRTNSVSSARIMTNKEAEELIKREEGCDRSSECFGILADLKQRGNFTAEESVEFFLKYANNEFKGFVNPLHHYTEKGRGTERSIRRDVARMWSKIRSLPQGVTIDDFFCYMPTHQYLCHPSRDFWAGSSINARIDPIEHGVDNDGNPIVSKPSEWLATNRYVDQMTWCPGFDMIIEHQMVHKGGLIPRKDWKCFNLYLPPLPYTGNGTNADKWMDHIEKVYGTNEAEHLIEWFAYKVQKPREKINYGIVLTGPQGVGKDTLLAPVRRAVGEWNFAEASPHQITGSFNPFIKSVILRINEARDLGDLNRYQFYEHMKIYMSAPPETLTCNEKNLREHPIFNVMGVVITTNHKSDGIYLPADDRRHYAVGTALCKEDFTPEYWDDLWNYYYSGGLDDVAKFLSEFDIKNFDPHAAPPKTATWWEIVNSNRDPQDAELGDIIDKLINKKATTIDKILRNASDDFSKWIREPKHSKQFLRRMESCGYVSVNNPGRKDGYWLVDGKRKNIFALATLNPAKRMDEARKFAEKGTKDDESDY